MLGAPAKIELHSSDKKLNEFMVSEIDKLVLKYENIFYLQNTKSEISKLNKNKFLVNPSRVRNVIEKSQFISKRTEGLFDVTVQPLWELYFDHFIINNNRIAPIH